MAKRTPKDKGTKPADKKAAGATGSAPLSADDQIAAHGIDPHRVPGVQHPQLVPTAKTINTLILLAKIWAEASRTGGMRQDKDCSGWHAYFVKLIAGNELGIPPASAIENIQVGAKITLSAKLAVTLMRRNGCQLDLIEATTERAVVRLKRPDSDTPIDVIYTIADAQRSGDAEKSTHKKHPINMLAHAAYRKAGLLHCQDLLMSVGYTHLELGLDDELPDMDDMFPDQTAAGELTADTVAVTVPVVDEDNGADATPDDITTSDEAHADTTTPDPVRTPDSATSAAAIGTDQTTPETPAPVTDPPAAIAPDGPRPDPWMDSDPAEANRLAGQIKEFLAHLKYAASDWKQWLATKGHAKLATAPRAVYQEAAKILTQLESIHTLRRLINDKAPDPDAHITDDHWRTSVLGRRGLTHDLQMPIADIEGIHAKLWSRATPFTKDLMPGHTTPVATTEGKSAGNG